MTCYSYNDPHYGWLPITIVKYQTRRNGYQVWCYRLVTERGELPIVMRFVREQQALRYLQAVSVYDVRYCFAAKS